MNHIWERVLQATDNDKPLLAFLQRLLTLDPEQRANFADLAHHPYLRQIDLLPVSDSSVAAVSDTFALPAALPAVPAPQQVVSMPCEGKTIVEGLQPVPDMPSLLWNPSSEAVCHMSSGSVYRSAAAGPLTSLHISSGIHGDISISKVVPFVTCMQCTVIHGMTACSHKY